MIDDNLNRLKVKRGTELPHAKLTESDVANIRAMIRDREELKRQAKALSNKQIALKFDVHQRTIDRISANENWIHV